MLTALKTKKGAWVKAGRGASGSFPGSYRDYTYIRAAPSGYATTAQQKSIGAKGRCVGQKCKGKTGADFLVCRHECTG